MGRARRSFETARPSSDSNVGVLFPVPQIGNYWRSGLDLRKRSPGRRPSHKNINSGRPNPVSGRNKLGWSRAILEEQPHAKYIGMWVTASRTAVLSIITGGGKWVEMTIPADPLYQHLLLTAERKFWRCVETGEPPRLFGIEPPRPKIEAVRIVDMSASNSWAEFAGVFCQTRGAHAEHDAAKAELKKLMPEDAKEAVGHGIRAKRSKSGAISFDLQETEAGHAAL